LPHATTVSAAANTVMSYPCVGNFTFPYPVYVSPQSAGTRMSQSRSCRLR